MRKKLQLGLIVGATTMLVAAGNCWAKSPSEQNQNGCDSSGGTPKKCVQAPEIDAGAGSGAIALLVGGLLLAAEKRRRCS